MTKKLQIVRRSLVNNFEKESYALFAIKPNAEGLSILDVTLDEKSLSTSTLGFLSAKISRGKIDADSIKPMLNGESGLTSEEKTQLADSYKDALFVYSEGHTFDFSKEGTTHKLKIVVGKDSNKVGEYEFVIDNTK